MQWNMEEITFASADEQVDDDVEDEEIALYGFFVCKKKVQ